MGLKQSPRAWFERFTKFLKTYSFIQNQGDPILFIKHSSLKKIIILIVYVNDVIVTYDDIKEIKSVKDLLAKEFVIKDFGKFEIFSWYGDSKIKTWYNHLSREKCVGFP